MKRVVKSIMVIAAAAALVCAMSVSVLAAVASPADQSLPEAEISPYADTAGDTSLPGEPRDLENPRTGIVTMLPVIVVGVAAGGTAILTAKKK